MTDTTVAETIAPTDRTAWRTVAMPTCYVCGKPIGRTTGGIVTAPNQVRHSNSRCPKMWHHRYRTEHALLHPECPVDWHDVWDHPTLSCHGDTLARLLASGGWAAINSMFVPKAGTR